MGIETKAVNDLRNSEESEEALLGKKRKKILPYPEKTEFKFFLGCLNDDDTRIAYEELLTKSFRCQNDLRKAGDVAVLDMQGTFDKEGLYHVVSRYAYLPEDLMTKSNKTER